MGYFYCDKCGKILIDDKDQYLVSSGQILCFQCVKFGAVPVPQYAPMEETKNVPMKDIRMYTIPMNTVAVVFPNGDKIYHYLTEDSPQVGQLYSLTKVRTQQGGPLVTVVGFLPEYESEEARKVAYFKPWKNDKDMVTFELPREILDNFIRACEGIDE